MSRESTVSRGCQTSCQNLDVQAQVLASEPKHWTSETNKSYFSLCIKKKSWSFTYTNGSCFTNFLTCLCNKAIALHCILGKIPCPENGVLHKRYVSSLGWCLWLSSLGQYFTVVRMPDACLSTLRREPSVDLWNVFSRKSWIVILARACCCRLFIGGSPAYVLN